MPITNALPVVSPDPTKTIRAARVLLALLPSGGTQINLSGRIENPSFPEPTKVERKVYDPTTKLLKTDRTVYTEVEAPSFSIKLDEPKSTAQLGIINGRWGQGTARLFVQDPSDVTLKVALLSNEFNAVWAVTGLDLGGDFVTSDLKVTINGDFTLTADATVT